jgi:hypothetical protein
MRASIGSSTIFRLAGAVAALWLCGAGAAWAGGGGESLTTLQAVIGKADGTTGLCKLLGMGSNFGNICPQLPTFTQAILEAAGLANSPPEVVAAQNGLPPGSNVYANNPAKDVVPPGLFSPTPFPLTANTSPALSELLSTVTPLAFISSQNAARLPTPAQLYDPNANTFLYAVTVSSIGFATPPGGTVPDTLDVFYEDLSRGNQTFTNGQVVAKFSLPLTVLNNNGTENPPVIVTLQIKATCTGGPSCLQAQVISGFGASASNPIAASQFGIQFALVFGASPTSTQPHAIFEVAVPLLVTGACVPATTGCPLPPPPPPNTDPAYFYALHNNGIAGQLNLGISTAFVFDDLGVAPSQPGILPTGGSSIGLAPTAGPLGPPPSCTPTPPATTCTPPAATFALCASLPGGNGNGQAPVPSVAAYYGIATNGGALLSAALSSTSVCPAF